jgi:predicted site-specific integrase-resolvase
MAQTVSLPTDASEVLLEVVSRLERLERSLALIAKQKADKEWLSVDEVARLVGRAPFTVRAWARLGRIRGEKRRSGRGASKEWVVSRQEVLRYEREGLLPLPNRE